MTLKAVPFTLDNVWAGFGQGAGLLHYEGTQLCLEYQLKDTVVGAVKSGLKQVRIPLKDLVSVNLTKGWLGTSFPGLKIVIQATRMDVLRDMPSASQGRIELHITSKNRDAAEELIAALYEHEETPNSPSNL